MTDKEFEEYFADLIKRVDFSAGTEDFREDLLVRCLAVLGEDDEEEGVELELSQLELLSAAGDDMTFRPDILEPMKTD